MTTDDELRKAIGPEQIDKARRVRRDLALRRQAERERRQREVIEASDAPVEQETP